MTECMLMTIPYLCVLGLGILIGLGIGLDRRKG